MEAGKSTSGATGMLRRWNKEIRQSASQQYRQTRADQERQVVLVGEAVMRRLGRGEWDEADFRQMMDEALSRPTDRALFDLD